LFIRAVASDNLTTLLGKGQRNRSTDATHPAGNQSHLPPKEQFVAQDRHGFILSENYQTILNGLLTTHWRSPSNVFVEQEDGEASILLIRRPLPYSALFENARCLIVVTSLTLRFQSNRSAEGSLPHHQAGTRPNC
jgi:hypothetical protein